MCVGEQTVFPVSGVSENAPLTGGLGDQRDFLAVGPPAGVVAEAIIEREALTSSAPYPFGSRQSQTIATRAIGQLSFDLPAK
jgi:hypothetical protein